MVTDTVQTEEVEWCMGACTEQCRVEGWCPERRMIHSICAPFDPFLANHHSLSNCANFHIQFPESTAFKLLYFPILYNISTKERGFGRSNPSYLVSSNPAVQINWFDANTQLLIHTYRCLQS